MLDLIEVAAVEVVVEEIAYRGRYLHLCSVHMRRRMKVVVLKAACWGTLEAQEEVLDLVEVAAVEETAYRGRYLHLCSVHMRSMKVVVLKAA